MKKLIVASLLALTICVANAEAFTATKPILCGNTAEVLESLKDFKETIVYAGINADNHLISVWVNPSAQTATITESNNQVTCILTIINNLQHKEIF
jgi:hypothetical protein